MVVLVVLRRIKAWIDVFDVILVIFSFRKALVKSIGRWVCHPDIENS